MKFTTPKGRTLSVFKTSWFTFGFAGHFNIFFISIKANEWNDQILKHELIHADQCADMGLLKWFRMAFDMDLVVKNEVEAYVEDGRFSDNKIAHIIATKYKVFPWFGCRTKPYTVADVITKIALYKGSKFS